MHNRITKFIGLYHYLVSKLAVFTACILITNTASGQDTPPWVFHSDNYGRQLPDTFIHRIHTFEYQNMPSWIKSEKSRISLSREKSQIGSRSLKWEMKPGSKLIFTLPDGDRFGKRPPLRGSYLNRFLSIFVFHIHMEKISKGNLKVQFLNNDTPTGSYSFNLVFPNWQKIEYPHLGARNRKDVELTNRVEIIASADAEPMDIHIDCLTFHDVGENKGLRRNPPKKPVEKVMDPINNPDDPRLKHVSFDKNILRPATEEEIAFLRKLENEIESKKTKVVLPKDIEHFKRYFTITNAIGWGKSGNRDIRKAWPLINGGLKNMALKYKRSKASKERNQLRELYFKVEKELIDMGYVAGGSISLGKSANPARDVILRSGATSKASSPEERRVAAEVLEGFSSTCALNILYNLNDPFDRRPEWLHFLPKFWGALASAQPTDYEKVVHQRFFTQKVSHLISNQTTARTGYKYDGSMMDHGMQYPGYCLGGLKNVCDMLFFYKNTPFKLTQECYEKVRKCFMTVPWYANLVELPKGHNGRRLSCNFNALRHAYKSLFLSSPFYNNGEYDKELGARLARLFPDVAKELNKKHNLNLVAEPAPQGNYTMPFAGTNSQRRGEWLAVVRGSGKYLRRYESMGGTFNESRFVGNGILHIIGGREKPHAPISPKGSGSIGSSWDWRMLDGATTTLVSYKELAANRGTGGKAIGQITNVGGVTHRGENGAFMLPLAQLGALVDAKKSYFFFDNRIVCLGSNIACKRDTKTLTTLFQKNLSVGTEISLYNHQELSWLYDFLRYDKTQSQKLAQILTVKEEKMINLDPTKNHWVIDPQNNGYYVPSGQDLKFGHRKQQVAAPWLLLTKPAEERYSIAYIDHGVKPTDAHYSYIIQVETTAEKMKRFSKQMQSDKPPVQILQHNKSAHIVHDAETNIWAATYFEPNDSEATEPLDARLSPVISVNHSCLIMAEPEGEKSWHLAIAEPNHVTSQPVVTMIKGKWKLAKEVKGIALEKAGENTKVTLTPEWGYSYNFTLIAE